MIDEICAEINNYFADDSNKYIGNFVIKNGVIAPSVARSDADYIRISGSHYNDGVHLAGDVLIDEEFHGGVWIMSPPASFLKLVSEIEQWEAKNGVDSTNYSPYTSESFGGYSYSKATGSNGVSVGWAEVFSRKLKPYRRIRL